MRDGDDENGPERTCVATRTARPIDELIRFVLDPAGRLTPDIRGKLPGRGVWVTNSRQAVAEAVRRKAFARSLKAAATVPADLADEVDQLLAADARQSLAMANKAGLVVAGFAKVETAIAKGHVRALLIAGDGGEDGRRRIGQAVKRSLGAADAIPVFQSFSSRELDLALGRENAIHAALLAGAASEAFLKRRDRLERFRKDAAQDAPTEAGPDAAEDAASTGPLPFSGHELRTADDTGEI